MLSTFELFDFGEDLRVKPPHRCSLSCGDPCHTYREIKAMESKIVEMKKALESTLNSYRGLRTKMNVLHDRFVSGVPLEVATTIFRFCLPEHDPIYSRTMFVQQSSQEENIARVLFTLGGVCKTWRQIIWSTPQLWSHLSICVKSTTFSTSISIAKDWITRSARVPLSIQVYLGNLDDAQVAEFEGLDDWLYAGMKDLAEVINACSNRWEYLDLSLPPSLFSMFHGEPSNLRALRIDNYSQPTDPGALLLTREGGQKPTPSHVAFGFVRFNALDVSWRNVTFTEAKGIDIQECVQLLREAPQLKSCCFEMIKPPRNPWTGARHVVHHELTELKIVLPALIGAEVDLMAHFTLPSLDSLTILLYAAPLQTQGILSLLERSSCNLGWLTLSGGFEGETLLAMLKQIPSLYYLSLKPCASNLQFTGEGFFKLLAETCEIWYEDESDDDDDTNDRGNNDDGGESSSAQNNPHAPQERRDEDSSGSSAPDDSDDAFLPELEYLEYSHFLPEEFTRLWDLIPGALGYPKRKEVRLEDESDPPSLRPLRSLIVSLEDPLYMSQEYIFSAVGRGPQHISRSTLAQMKELTECGCEIKVLVPKVSLMGSAKTEPDASAKAARPYKALLWCPRCQRCQRRQRQFAVKSPAKFEPRKTPIFQI